MLLVLLTSLAGSLSLGVPAARAAIPVDPRHSVAILIDGLCSARPAGGAVSGGFAAPGGLVDQLRAAGWPADSVVPYSYRGGAVDADGRWQSAAYGCDDTYAQGIRQDAEVLDAQIQAIVTAHPNTDVHLVGFSLGGLVAMAYLAQFSGADAWSLPSGGRLADVVTLDAPLGGIPAVVTFCQLTPTCATNTPAGVPPAISDLGSLWDHGSGRPAGATRSVERFFGGGRTNQGLADAARDHGIRILAVGNLRDWTYRPTSQLDFQDTQWLAGEAAGQAVYSRVITSGLAVCPDASSASQNALAALDCNHDLVMSDPGVAGAIVGLFGGVSPAASQSCVAGAGGCLALPPLRNVILSSSIAAGVVRPGATFRDGPVAVASGSRVTLRFASSPALPGSRVEIWARSQTGAFHRLTTRLADSTGVVLYVAPAVTAWTAYQARFAGDAGTARAVSRARVATIR